MAGAIITPRHFAKKSEVFQPIARPNNGWIELCANGMNCARALHRILIRISHSGPDNDSGTLFARLRLFNQVGGLLLRAGRQQLSVILSCVHESPARSVFAGARPPILCGILLVRDVHSEDDFAMSLASIQKEIFQLNSRERAMLIDLLWESLDEGRLSEFEQKWAAESEDRIDAFERGELHAVDGPAALQGLRSSLRK